MGLQVILIVWLHACFWYMFTYVVYQGKPCSAFTCVVVCIESCQVLALVKNYTADVTHVQANPAKSVISPTLGVLKQQAITQMMLASYILLLICSKHPRLTVVGVISALACCLSLLAHKCH